jgi:hypothetical protein
MWRLGLIIHSHISSPIRMPALSLDGTGFKAGLTRLSFFSVSRKNAT